MKWGSKPVDDGYFLFTDEEKKRFLKLEPEAKDFIKPLVSANEFLNQQMVFVVKRY